MAFKIIIWSITRSMVILKPTKKKKKKKKKKPHKKQLIGISTYNTVKASTKVYI